MADYITADEFEIIEIVENRILRKAERESREAWERYRCNYMGNVREQINDDVDEAAPHYSFSHFLTEHGVQNLFVWRLDPHYSTSKEMVIRGRGLDERTWGRENIMVVTNRWWEGMDVAECLHAMTNFDGSLYLDRSLGGLSQAEAFALYKAWGNSYTTPHTLSITLDHTAYNSDELINLTRAVRHNSKIRNLAIQGSRSLKYRSKLDKICLQMEGISLDRLCLSRVLVTEEFMEALPRVCCVTHSLTLHDLIFFTGTEIDPNPPFVCFSNILHSKLKHLHLLDFHFSGNELSLLMEFFCKCTDTSLHSLSLGTLDSSQEEFSNQANLIGIVVDALHQSSLPVLRIYGKDSQVLTSPAIDAQLLINQKNHSNAALARLKEQQKVPAAAVRMFICGDPYAGKTTLLSSLSPQCARSSWMSLVDKVTAACFLPWHSVAQYERTRGIEIHRIIKDGIQLSLWDLAGQKEFHAFHDIMFPDPSGGYGSPTLFMFVWSPIESKSASGGARKNMDHFKASFLYWLKFIASKTRQSNILRKLILVITRKDQMVNLSDDVFSRIKMVAASVANDFKLIIEVVEVLMVDARNPSCVKPLLSCIFKSAQALLEGVEVYGICSAVSKYLSSRKAQESLVKGKPIISWDDFANLMRRKSEFQVKDSEVQKAVAFTLNDSGDIIYLDNLSLVILDPNWFCHEVMGSLLNFDDSDESKVFFVSDGYIEQADLESVLKRTTQSKVEGSVLVKIMEAMHLCYRDSTDKGGKIFIPATLSKSKTESCRQWRMQGRITLEAEDGNYKYVGRRLECDRKDVTMLTPGLFPMIQVVFGKSFSGKEADLKVVEECMSICLLDMEIIVEFGRGKLGHVMDVMVRASANKLLRNGQNALAYVEEIVSSLIKLCAQPQGNQGVTLVESIIRPDCLHGPEPLPVRDDQCVLVLDLKKKLRKQLEEPGELRQLGHLWKSGAHYLQPTPSSFMDLLGFEVYMQVLTSYEKSLQDASVSLSHVASCDQLSHTRPHENVGGRQISAGNVDVASTSTTSISLQEEDEISLELMKGHHGEMSTNDGKRPLIVDSCQQEVIEDDVEEDIVGGTNESQGQNNIVDSIGESMATILLHSVDRKVDSLKRRVDNVNRKVDKVLDVQKNMERKVDNMLDSIERMQNDVLPRIQVVVEKCFNFAVGREAGRMPRFVFLTDELRDGDKGGIRMVIPRLFKELKRVRVELCCEHRGGAHRVDRQDGVWVTVVDDKEAFVVKALPYVKGFLKVLTLLGKVGAHVVAGAGTMVPNLTQLVGLVFDTPGMLDGHSSAMLTSTPVSQGSLKAYQEWLGSVLEKHGGTGESNIYDKFKLKSVTFEDTGKVAWLCHEHYQQYCQTYNVHSDYLQHFTISMEP